MRAIFTEGQLVSIDARLPNLLFEEALHQGELEDFRGLRVKRREQPWGKSRIDFLLSNGEEWLVEVKSCSLVIKGEALFPDVPTERGRRHLRELIKALEEGYRVALVWVVQRGDARYLRPYYEVDPRFAETLKEAVKKGVKALAYYGQLRGREIRIEGRLPLKLRQ